MCQDKKIKFRDSSSGTHLWNNMCIHYTVIFSVPPILTCTSANSSINIIHQTSRSWDSSVNIVTRLRARWLGFNSRQRQRPFLFAIASEPSLGPTQHPIKWVPKALSLGVKWPGREADHSSPSNAEVKNAFSCTSTTPIRHHGVVLG
jgi:hypothetical protein